MLEYGPTRMVETWLLSARNVVPTDTLFAIQFRFKKRRPRSCQMGMRYFNHEFERKKNTSRTFPVWRFVTFIPRQHEYYELFLYNVVYCPIIE
jgi:hypothetical protein